MRLRQRMALTTVAVCVPWLVGSAWLHQLSHERADLEMLPQVTVAHMLAGGRSACEANPGAWVGAPFPPPPTLPGGRTHRGGPWEIKLYSHAAATFSAVTPETAVDPVAPVRLQVDGCSLALDVPMPWSDGPCNRVVICRPLGDHGGPRGLSWRLLAPAGIALASLLVALGPLVRRLRRLTAQVKAAAQHGYDAPIEIAGDDEVTELASAFAEASSKLRAAVVAREQRERALRDFLEDTTHDVMIPLTVLQGHLASLRETTPGVALDGACNEAHYIASLLHNLGAAAKLETVEPQAQRQQVELDALVVRVVARHHPIAKHRNVTLEFAVPPTQVFVRGDVTLIEQAVSNIVYNAVRYNRDGGNVAVKLEHGDDGTPRIVVLDDGPGIDEAVIARLRERYSRGDAARTRAPHGQGLGLHIAQRVCDAHGWRLRLSRSEFGGLQVEFTMADNGEQSSG